MRTKYLDQAVAPPGLPGRVRVRVALDVLEHCAHIAAASSGSGGARPTVGDVVLDDAGAATISRAGKPAQLMTLLWEILAGKAAPSDETPWSDPASDLPDDAMGALASLSMRPPSSAADLSKRFAAIAGATAASRADVVAALSRPAASDAIAGKDAVAHAASKADRGPSAAAPPAHTPVVPSSVGAATIPAPAVKVKELLGLSKEDLAPALADAVARTAQPEPTPAAEEPRRVPPPRPSPPRESGPPKTAFARVMLAKAPRPSPTKSDAPRDDEASEGVPSSSGDGARVDSSRNRPPPLLAPEAGSERRSSAPEEGTGASSPAPPTASELASGTSIAEAEPSRPRASVAPRAVVATGLVFSQPSEAEGAIAAQRSTRGSMPPRRDSFAALRADAAQEGAPPSHAAVLRDVPTAEATYTGAEIPIEGGAGARRPWLLSGVAIGLVVLIGLWGWGRTKPPPSDVEASAPTETTAAEENAAPTGEPVGAAPSPPSTDEGSRVPAEAPRAPTGAQPHPAPLVGHLPSPTPNADPAKSASPPQAGPPSPAATSAATRAGAPAATSSPSAAPSAPPAAPSPPSPAPAASTPVAAAPKTDGSPAPAAPVNPTDL